MIKLRPDWHNLILGLAVIAALWLVLGLHTYLVVALAAVTIASALVGGVAGSVIWGVGLIGVAALAWLHFGAQRLALVLAIIGVVYVALAVAKRKG